MSSTQTITQGKIQSSRTHDYLYDPLYSLSSDRDHARATFKAHTGTDRIKRVPHFKTMFSDLRHFPRYSIHLEVQDPVPKFIPRQWRGYGEQQREALIRYTTFNYDPTVQVPPKEFPKANVSGIDRYKYFRRPIIPFLQQVPPDVLLQSSKMDPLTAVETEVGRPPTPATRTVEVQTDYRESETQTDPYTPEYVIRPGSQPELLTLATLSYGHGLPAGLAEVEMIERARAKRAWEATLPALNDTENHEKRKRMMDEQERREWAFREQEIEKLQEARLEVLKRILDQREEDHAELNTKRLDRLWSNKQQEKEKKFNRIEKEHIKTVRKLHEKRRTVEGKFERRQIVKDYSSYESQTYAPMSRVGVFLDRGSEQYNVRSHHLTTYQGLLELEASLPDFVTQPRIQAPKPKSGGKGGFVKRRQRRQRELEEVANVIELAKRPPEPEKPLKFLVKVEKPIPRPATPSVEVPSQLEEEVELATIFLQKVIRGRAIQNMSSVFNGFIMGVIMLNSLVIGLETIEEWKDTQANVFKALDEFFLSIYTMEFLMKLYAEPRGYWKSSYNRFDFSILFLSYVQVIMDELNVGDKILTPLRLLRAARTLRTISFIEGLQVLVTALIDTIRNSVLNVVILLAMLMAFFAVVGYYIFGYEEETGDKKNWGTLSTAMLTLFTFVTVDGWTEIQKDLDKRPYSQWFTVIFIFLGHFIFTNLFIGIIIMNIHEATEKFITQQRQEREAILQMKKDFLFQRQHDDVKEMLEKQRNSQYENFQDMTLSFQQSLRHDDYVIMSDPCANLTWIEAFITTVDHMDLYMHRCQQIQFQIANALADMVEMKLKEKEEEISSTLPRGMQLFMRAQAGFAKKNTT